MVRIILVSFLFLGALLVSTTGSAQSSLDLRGNVGGSGIPGGSIIPGYDSATCDGTIEGAIRYNSSTSCAEFCDGTDWVCPNSSGSGSGGCTAPTLCPNIGDVCDDSNAGNDPDPQFAGFMVYNDPNSADTGECKPLYVTNDNQAGSSQWKTSTGTDDIATDSTEDGKLNDSQISNSTTFPAFKLCKDLTNGGFNDWYLPARDELHLLWKNQGAINANAAGNFVFGDDYLSSTEYDADDAWFQYFEGTSWGGHGFGDKTFGAAIRCVRRD